MGLDMNLYGEKIICGSEAAPEAALEDGFPLSSKILDLGYWRKHPNLHGYIVDTFANGKDECQRIYLDENELQKIIEALENDAIYDEPVMGFFFGKSYFPGEKDEYSSYEEQKSRDIDIFTKALNWIQNNPYKEWRNVYYQASW